MYRRGANDGMPREGPASRVPLPVDGDGCATPPLSSIGSNGVGGTDSVRGRFHWRTKGLLVTDKLWLTWPIEQGLGYRSLDGLGI